MIDVIRNKILHRAQKSYTSKDIFLLAFVLLCINLAFNIVCRLSGLSYPYTSFLFMPEERFGDFFKLIDALHIVKAWDGFNANDQKIDLYRNIDLYGRPALTVYNYFFAKLILLAGNKYLVFGAYYAALIALLIRVSLQLKNSLLSVALIILSYPMLFAIDRGNIAVLIFLLLLIALVTDKAWLSAFLIAVVTSLRFTPLIFIVPLLIKEPVTLKRVAQIILFTLLWLVLIHYLSVWVIMHRLGAGPPILLYDTTGYYKVYILGQLGMAFGSSLFLPVTRIAEFMARRVSAVTHLLPYIRPAAMPALALIIVAVWSWAKGSFRNNLQKVKEFKWIIFVTVISFIVFSPATGDYYLLLLCIPLLMFPETRFSFLQFIIYALLLAPKNYIYFNTINPCPYVSLQVFINPVLLLILFFSEFNLIKCVWRS